MSKRDRESFASSGATRREEEEEEESPSTGEYGVEPLASSAADPAGDASDSNGESHTRKKQRVDEDGTAVASSSSSAQEEVRLLIESASVGPLIGKGGANISNLRTTSGCMATILKNEHAPNASERVLSIKGTLDHVCVALKMVLDLLFDSSRSDDGASRDASLSLLVHKLAVGAIIGPAGSLVKESQAVTKARIHISTETLGFSTDKNVTVTGSRSEVHAAATRLLDQLHHSPLKPGTKSVPYQPSATTAAAHTGPGTSAQQQAAQKAPVPQSGILPMPFSMPPPHAMMQANPYAPHPQAAYPPQTAPFGYPPPGPYGYPQYGYPPPGPYGMPMPPADPYGVAAVPGGAPAAPSAYGSRPPRDRLADPNCTTQRIAIPSVCSGVVIGHGGSIIRDLVKKSGAKISLAAPDPTTPTERVVTIIGTADQIQAAIYLIQQQVESYTPGKPPPPPTGL